MSVTEGKRTVVAFRDVNGQNLAVVNRSGLTPQELKAAAKDLNVKVIDDASVANILAALDASGYFEFATEVLKPASRSWLEVDDGGSQRFFSIVRDGVEETQKYSICLNVFFTLRNQASEYSPTEMTRSDLQKAARSKRSSRSNQSSGEILEKRRETHDNK